MKKRIIMFFALTLALVLAVSMQMVTIVSGEEPGSTDPTEASTDPTEALTDPTEASTDPTEALTVPTEALTDSTEAEAIQCVISVAEEIGKITKEVDLGWRDHGSPLAAVGQPR